MSADEMAVSADAVYLDGLIFRASPNIIQDTGIDSKAPPDSIQQKAASLSHAPYLPTLNGGRPTLNSSSTRPSLEPSSQTNSSHQ